MDRIHTPHLLQRIGHLLHAVGAGIKHHHLTLWSSLAEQGLDIRGTRIDKNHLAAHLITQHRCHRRHGIIDIALRLERRVLYNPVRGYCIGNLGDRISKSSIKQDAWLESQHGVQTGMFAFIMEPGL